MQKVNWIITDHSIVVNYDGQTHQIARADACATKLIEALKNKDFDSIPDLVSAAKRLEKTSNGLFTLKDGVVFIDGVAAPAVLSRKIEEFMNEGLPYEPLVLFAKNLQANPSFRAVNELYSFLEKNNHPITDTGNFIAYKKVRNNLMDIYSGTYDNSVGNVVEMPRNQVDEDQNTTCSHGLHVANWYYASDCYGSKSDTMLEVEVNPADVVAVPVDYNNAKMRVYKYKVLSVVDEELSTSLRITQPVVVDNDSSCDEEDECIDVEYCMYCDCELRDYEGDICSLCEEEEEEDEDECNEECDCSCEEDEEEYPWKDELND